MRDIIVTDYGEYEAPEEISRLARECQKRSDGRPDLRTWKGRMLEDAVAEFVRRKNEEDARRCADAGI